MDSLGKVLQVPLYPLSVVACDSASSSELSYTPTSTSSGDSSISGQSWNVPQNTHRVQVYYDLGAVRLVASVAFEMTSSAVRDTPLKVATGIEENTWEPYHLDNNE